MKTARIAGIFAAFALAALTAVFALRFSAPAPANAASADAKAVLYNTEGNVTFFRKGVELPAEIDTPLMNGDSFKTGAESEMDITVGGYSGIRLYADGELTLDKVAEITLTFKLKQGRMLISTKKLPSGLTIEIDMPNAIVRTTVSDSQYMVLVHPGAKKPDEARSLVTVRKGRLGVYVKKASASANVIEGTSLDITPEVYLPNPRNATEEEIAWVRKVNQIPVLPPDA